MLEKLKKLQPTAERKLTRVLPINLKENVTIRRRKSMPNILDDTENTMKVLGSEEQKIVENKLKLLEKKIEEEKLQNSVKPQSSEEPSS